jgi:hypothetical protein
LNREIQLVGSIKKRMRKELTANLSGKRQLQRNKQISPDDAVKKEILFVFFQGDHAGDV